MPDKKLTDNDIKKALECCNKSKDYTECERLKCPVYRECKIEHKALEDALLPKVIDLINRLQAENEELKSAINGFRGYEDKIKAEAYKECIEKVKEKTYTYSDITGYRSTVVDVCEIDGVYEELVGDDK